VSRFKQTAEFYNFVCHFGQFELLDFVEPIVIPAFHKTGKVREWGKSAYFLLDVQLTVLRAGNQRHPAIVGRFVVDTELSRAQVFEEGRLRGSPRTMKTAPSSVFALLLDNHKLLFAKEVSGGPGIGAFRTTIELLFNRQRLDYVQSLYEQAKTQKEEDGRSERVSKKSLFESIPRADVKILPLLGESGIRDFLARFTVLRELQIRVIKPNNELDNDELFDDLQKARENVNAESTTLVHRNSEGLKKAAAAKQAHPAMQGNAIVRFSGVGANAEKLSGTNDDFKVVSQPIELPRHVKDSGTLMLNVFTGMLTEGLIRISEGRLSAANTEKLRKILER